VHGPYLFIYNYGLQKIVSYKALHASRVCCKEQARFYAQEMVVITEEWRRYERTICAFYMGYE